MFTSSVASALFHTRTVRICMRKGVTERKMKVLGRTAASVALRRKRRSTRRRRGILSSAQSSAQYARQRERESEGARERGSKGARARGRETERYRERRDKVRTCESTRQKEREKGREGELIEDTNQRGEV